MKKTLRGGKNKSANEMQTRGSTLEYAHSRVTHRPCCCQENIDSLRAEIDHLRTSLDRASRQVRNVSRLQIDSLYALAVASPAVSFARSGCPEVAFSTLTSAIHTSDIEDRILSSRTPWSAAVIMQIPDYGADPAGVIAAIRIDVARILFPECIFHVSVTPTRRLGKKPAAEFRYGRVVPSSTGACTVTWSTHQYPEDWEKVIIDLSEPSSHRD